MTGKFLDQLILWLSAISQVFPPASFFYFRKFLQCLWSFHLPLVDSSSYPGAPFRCGAFAFFHMMLAPRLPLKIPRSTRVRESYSCKFGNAWCWTSLQWPPWGQKKSSHCKDVAVRKEVLNKSQCMDFLSAGTKKSGRFQQQRILSCCQREVPVSRGSTAFYLSAWVRALPMLTLLIFKVGSSIARKISFGRIHLIHYPSKSGNRSNGSTPANENMF